jgi:hypothetical protein
MLMIDDECHGQLQGTRDAARRRLFDEEAQEGTDSDKGTDGSDTDSDPAPRPPQSQQRAHVLLRHQCAYAFACSQSDTCLL